jgi:hypothetical protein
VKLLDGLTGQIGVLVQPRVALEHNIHQELVLTPMLEVLYVLETATVFRTAPHSFVNVIIT